MILDHFIGSGTTGKVALRFGRTFIGIDSNAGYLALATERIGGNGEGVGSDHVGSK